MTFMLPIRDSILKYGNAVMCWNMDMSNHLRLGDSYFIFKISHADDACLVISIDVDQRS